MFTELLRENFRNRKLKQCLLPPLGELMYLIATQVKVVKNGVQEIQKQTLITPLQSYMLVYSFLDGKIPIFLFLMYTIQKPCIMAGINLFFHFF